MQNNRYYRKISAMVLTLMITASATAAVHAAPADVPTDETSSGIVSSSDSDTPDCDEEET